MNTNKISFKIIPILRLKDKPQIPIVWEQAHANEPDKIIVYTFNKIDYTKAIKEAKSKVTQKEKFVYDE